MTLDATLSTTRLCLVPQTKFVEDEAEVLVGLEDLGICKEV